MRKASGLAREVWRFLYRATLEERHWHVLEQDREMLVSMPPDARKREMLYQHDLGVARIRQALVNKAKAQLAAQDAAGRHGGAGRRYRGGGSVARPCHYDSLVKQPTLRCPDTLNSGAGPPLSLFSFSLADEGNGAPGGAGRFARAPWRTMTRPAARRGDGARTPVT